MAPVFGNWDLDIGYFQNGVSYTGSTRALGACRQGSIPCTPT